MRPKNFTYLVSIAAIFYLFSSMGCSHSTVEPKPVDCATSTLALSFTSADPTSCTTNNGSISSSTIGGDAPYQFALDTQPFAATSNFTGLGAGTYQLKVKDKNGCERTTSVTLKPFGSTLAATTATVDSGCKTAKGSITINASGGSGPYSYKINDGAASSIAAVTNLSAGSYSVKITDNGGCSITQSVKVLSGTKFSVDVKGIIEANCAISGCHVAGGASTSFTTLANVQASASQIKSRTQSGNMPKNAAKLPQAELDAIACWVDDGAANN